MPITFQTTEEERKINKELVKSGGDYESFVAVDIIFGSAIYRAERRLN